MMCAKHPSLLHSSCRVLPATQGDRGLEFPLRCPPWRVLRAVLAGKQETSLSFKHPILPTEGLVVKRRFCANNGWFCAGAPDDTTHQDVLESRVRLLSIPLRQRPRIVRELLPPAGKIDAWQSRLSIHETRGRRAATGKRRMIGRRNLDAHPFLTFAVVCADCAVPVDGIVFASRRVHYHRSTPVACL